MGSVFNDQLVGRVIRCARLDASAYEEVEHDENATIQSCIVVLLASISISIGTRGIDGLGSVVMGSIRSLMGWIVVSAIIWFVGTKLMPGPLTRTTPVQLLRTIGFSWSPELLSFVAVLPVVGGLLGSVVTFWGFAAMFIAIRSALDTSTKRTIAIFGVSLVAALAVFVTIYLTLGW